ncbi:hypothetical protein BB934_28330 (plasmid) [Microvirga ossetica]|uniref:Uncharacterized protein n=1 Tax=Microvirga ossetica TaxID=1882682 RepID=A0A1B2EQI3_9HYPH|nr:hypothetical protein BB934_28330 [Microvirga ossetica]
MENLLGHKSAFHFPDTAGEWVGAFEVGLAFGLQDLNSATLEGSMSLCPTLCADVPASTAAVAHAAFPRGNSNLRLCDQLGTISTDAQFAPLFASCRQPTECPWRLALVSLLQFAENLSDRQAAEAVAAALTGNTCWDWN